MATLIELQERNGEAQDARTARAIAEGPDYTWTKNPLGWTVSTRNGCYQVTERGCSCPDHQRRQAGTLGLCKHRIALAHKLLVEQAPVADPKPAPKPKGMTDAESAWFDGLFN